MEECICCGSERRMDRMSLHILEKHRDNLIATKNNKRMLEECLKHKEGTARIYLTADDKKRTKSYIVSFGYNSGWAFAPKMKKVLDKIKEHKDDHLKTCAELMDEIKEREAKNGVSTDAPQDTSEAYDNLKRQYDELLKKSIRLERELKSCKEEIEENEAQMYKESAKQRDFLKVVVRVYGMDKEEIRDIETQVADLYMEYTGDRSIEDVDDAAWNDLNKAIETIKPFRIDGY